MTQLILGGARSGKSRLAEERARTWADRQAWADQAQRELIYLATASVGDREMAARIEQHRERRDARWQLIEESEDLAGVIERYRNHSACLVVDCLTLWISNCLHSGNWENRRDQFLERVTSLNGEQSPLELILVSNEVGSGIVPLGELSRQFVDASGWLHQALAAHCEKVTLVVAGLPLELKAS